MTPLATLFQNKHTTLAAFVIVAAKAIEAQWPAYKPLCDTVIEGATAYGLLLAGDAKPPKQNESAPPPPLPPPVH